MKQCIISLIAVLHFVPLFGQTHIVDSLKNRMLSAKNNEEKLSVLLSLCKQQQSLSADSFFHYAQNALLLASQQKNKEALWETQYIYASALSRLSLSDSSLAVTDKLLAQITDIPHNYKLYHEVQSNKILLLITKKKYKEATSEAGKLLVSSDRYDDDDGKAIAYYLLGRATSSDLNDYNNGNGNFKQVIDYYHEALSVSSNPDFYKKYEKIFMALGIIYIQLPKSNFDSGLYYINKAYDYASERNNFQVMGSCIGLKGSVYSMMKRYDSSEFYFMKSIDFQKRLGDPEKIIGSYEGMINFYLDRNNYQKALTWCDSTRAYFTKNNIPLDLIFYGTYADCLRQTGDYKTLSQVLDTIILLKGEIYQKNRAQDIAELQTKYDVQSKEVTIQKQHLALIQKNYWMYGSFVLLLLLSIIGILLFYIYKRKQKIKIVEAEENERRRIAADLHDNIGAKLSHIRRNATFISDSPQALNKTDEQKYLHNINHLTTDAIIDLRETIWVLNAETITVQGFSDKLKTYLHQQLTDYANINYDFKENISENRILSPQEAMQLFRIMQELIHNAVKHSSANKIIVELSSATSEGFELVVKDNGCGFDTGLKKQDHYGLDNIKERAKSVQAIFKIESNANAGTKAVLIKNSTNELFRSKNVVHKFVK